MILPMTVIRRLDAVLEPTKDAVLEQKKWLDEANIIDQVGPLTQAAGQQFYPTFPIWLKSPKVIRSFFLIRCLFLHRWPSRWL